MTTSRIDDTPPRHARRFDVAWLPALLLGFLAGAIAPDVLGAVTQKKTWGEAFRRIPPELRQVVDAMERAFNQRDAEALAPNLTEDFSLWQVGAEGPKQVLSGREQTVEQMKKFFASPTWTRQGDSEIHRLGMLGDTLVQFEFDTLQTDKGPIRQKTLNVYQYRDGKLWREFSYLVNAP